MNKSGLLTALLISPVAISAAYADEITVTPHDVGGAIPSGYDKVFYKLADGNWTSPVSLPASAKNNAVVEITSNATYNTNILTGNVDIAISRLAMKTGEKYKFTYSASKNKWIISGNNVSYFNPEGHSERIDENHKKITFFDMYNGGWFKQIYLPKTGKYGDIITVRSNASWDSSVSGENQLYPSSTKLKTGDSYTFIYHANKSAWVIEQAPLRIIDMGKAMPEVPYPTSPQTLLEIKEGTSFNITLPARAGDRDQITITSDSTKLSEISNSHINYEGSLKIKKGDEYKFKFIAEKGVWSIIKSPVDTYQAGKLSGGNIPTLLHPVVNIESGDGNYVADLKLPMDAKRGDRVVVISHALWGFNVSAGGVKIGRIDNGDTTAFKMNDQGLWEQETRIINMLLLYSDKAADRLGEAAMRARMFESFALTNEALENSGANFRLRQADIVKIKAAPGWKALGDPLYALRSDPEVQQLRDKLHADAIYYTGTEEGCGLAWVRSSAFNMVATGSINCGTTVMRHEFGHNMGLSHGGEGSNYAQGYTKVSSIMAGNAIPFYATPYRYTEDYGIPMGIENQFDAVRAINEFSATVAAYR